MQVAESTLLEGKMIHLNEQTGAFEPETLHILVFRSHQRIPKSA